MVKREIPQLKYGKRHEPTTTLEAINNRNKEYTGHNSQTLARHAVQFVTLARGYYPLASPRLAEAP